MILTRIATKIPNPKEIALNTICLGAICITSVAGSLSFATSAAFAQYGLGLPKSAGSGGATRGANGSTIPTVILLVPRDGAKTTANRPTFLWYINSPEANQATSTTLPKIGDNGETLTITFFLRDGNNISAKPIFTAKGKIEKSGLYRFTLPDTAPELVIGKVQRWQIRWQVNGSQSDVYAPIRRDDDPTVVKEIASAKNDLEKARIYAKNTYWYDAIAAYTSWLSQNPEDNVASKERSELFKIGLQNHSAFVDVKKDENDNTTEEFNSDKFTNFLTKLDATKDSISIALEPKKSKEVIQQQF